MEVKTLLGEFHLNKLGGLSMVQTRLSDPVTRWIHRMTGIDEPALHSMTFARYAGNALPHLPVHPWTDTAMDIPHPRLTRLALVALVDLCRLTVLLTNQRHRRAPGPRQARRARRSRSP
ncbi:MULTISPECIES: hypothetical protein [unclassified Streptomyces]|uniref:hypothetical protein n=1 Tax=unclassified Streptomyces TaxID=2593676 RepID=UPI002E308672|nr:MULTISPECIES: hypothetical protein [unclassified Streptomyces]